MQETLTLGDAEFTIRWDIGDSRVCFDVWEVAARECLADGVMGPPEYEKDGTSNGEALTQNPLEAERYASGSIKWDGCSEVTFAESLHLCGRSCWQAHIAVVAYLWRRAGELQRSPLPDEFTPLSLA